MVSIEKIAALKMAAYLSGKTFEEIAKETKIPRPYLSMACSGRLILTDEEKHLIAKSLNVEVSQIFPE